MNFSIPRLLAGADSWTELGRMLRGGRHLRAWIEAGRPAPVPHPVKVRNILTVAQLFGLKKLVETGTQAGATLAATMHHFDELYSIEIYEPSVVAARKRFADHPKVKIIHGDSATALPEVVKQIDDPILFWLDGHYSGEGTGMGEDHSPILEEIRHILDLRPVGRDAIIIDDARLFIGKDGYPPLDAFVKEMKSAFGVKPRCADDAIFILPH
ncbi:MAG TPA: hypothetical protein VMU22_09805 [Rhizomicrobium sp.]|nr:hypothetical protein [Rhizomicrobium sp.]